MLDYNQRLTYQDSAGYTWVSYGDDQNHNVFYIVPKPQFVQQPGGAGPELSILQLQTNDPATNGSGSVQLSVELSVPQDVIDAIAGLVRQQFPGAQSPVYQALDVNPGAWVYLLVPLGGAPVAFSAAASGYGGNVATFVLQLSPNQMKAFLAALSGSGSSGLSVSYQLTVPARLQAVKATLSFDAAIAYQYQVTQPSYNMWGEQTDPGSVDKLLKQSAASTVDISWGNEQPSPTLQQAVADWANSTLADLVAAEVSRAIEMQGEQSSQSFQINSVASFSNTYVQNQVIRWYIQPQGVLPALGSALPQHVRTVNEQQQQMTVTVHLPFGSDVSKGPGRSPPLTFDTKQQVLVQSVVATITYPGLPEAQGTLTFTASGSQTVTTPYQNTPNWTLHYTVHYAGAQAPVSATMAVSQARQTIGLLEAGILMVTFDATPAYNASPAPSNVGVDLAFTHGGLQPTRLSVKTVPTNRPQTITTVQAPPITTYNYTPVYTFGTSGPVEGHTVAGASGDYQLLSPINGVNLVQLIVYVPPSSPVNPVLNAEVKLWYESALPSKVPGLTAAPTPTPQAPQTFNPTLSSGGFWKFTFPRVHQRQRAARLLRVARDRGGRRRRDRPPARQQRAGGHPGDAHPALLHDPGVAGRDRLGLGVVLAGAGHRDSDPGQRERHGHRVEPAPDVDVDRAGARQPFRDGAVQPRRADGRRADGHLHLRDHLHQERLQPRVRRHADSHFAPPRHSGGHAARARRAPPESFPQEAVSPRWRDAPVARRTVASLARGGGRDAPHGRLRHGDRPGRARGAGSGAGPLLPAGRPLGLDGQPADPGRLSVRARGGARAGQAPHHGGAGSSAGPAPSQVGAHRRGDRRRAGDPAPDPGARGLPGPALRLLARRSAPGRP
jgi:hypothetical protein